MTSSVQNYLTLGGTFIGCITFAELLSLFERRPFRVLAIHRTWTGEYEVVLEATQ